MKRNYLELLNPRRPPPSRRKRMKQQAVLCATVLVSLGCSALMASPQDNPTDCAMLIARRMSSDPNSIDDLIAMAQCLGAGRAQQSGQLIDYVLQMPHIKENRATLDVSHLLAISSLYSTTGQSDDALAFLSEVLADAERLPDTRKRLIRQYVVRAYADIGEYERVVQIVDKYTSNHPDAEDDERSTKARELAYVAFCACREGKTDYAMEMLSRAYANSKGIRTPHWKAGNLSYIAYGFLECGNVDRGLAIAEEISDALDLMAIDEERFCPVRFKVGALIGVAQKLAETGRRAEAVAILDKASAIAEKIEHRYLKAEMMKDVAAAYADAGKYVVRSWWDLGMQPRTEAPAPLDSSKALQVARAIEHPVIKGMTLNTIAQQYVKAGDNDKGTEVASEALQLVRSIAGDSRDAYEGELGFEEISKPRVLAEITETFVKACASEPDLQTSKRRAVQHIDAAREWLGTTRRSSSAHRRIALLYAETGEQQKAMQIAMELMKGAYLWSGVDILETLAIRAVETGKYDEAGTAVAALEEGFRTREAAKIADADIAWFRQVVMSNMSRVRRTVSVKLAEKGQYAQSLEMVAQITKPAEKALALIQIGAYYPADGNKMDAEAKNILRDIGQETRSMRID